MVGKGQATESRRLNGLDTGLTGESTASTEHAPVGVFF
jgi:hypothetical protein